MFTKETDVKYFVEQFYTEDCLFYLGNIESELTLIFYLDKVWFYNAVQIGFSI